MTPKPPTPRVSGAPSLDELAIAWRPAPDAFRSSPAGRLGALMGAGSYEELAARAAADPRRFWAAAAREIDIPWVKPYDDVLDLDDGIEWPHFFSGAELNASELAVDRWVRSGRGDHPAIVWRGDLGETEELSYDELRDQVSRAAAAFRDVGIGVGDTIGILLPMVPAAAVALLAAARIGAIAVPMFSGYGAEAIRTRLRDARAKLLVTCDAYPRRGKTVRLKEVADAALIGVDTVEAVLVVRRLGTFATMTEGRDRYWHHALDDVGAQTDVPAGYRADTPCMLLYTSGSTGRPKGCVHTHAGLPIKIAAEARYGFGVDTDAVVCWVTDMGWVMGPWLVYASLVNGGTAVLFEGVPDHPAPDRLWSVVEQTKTTVLGIAPTLIRSLMAAGEEWPRRHDLSSLRAIGSTGEPWNLGPWWWCFRYVGGERVPIVNISGGTEVGGSILSGSIATPLKPTSFAGPVLGMAPDVVDAEGRSVRGEVGELVVRQPWPGMTCGFWGDDDRYLDTYWRRYPGMWHHGDFAYVDRDGFWFVLGRSDDTIKLAGKRLGPAEVESAMQSTGLVVESAAVGLPDEIKGEVLGCFVVLRPDAGEGALDRVAAAVEAEFGKPMRPAVVKAISSLPKTRNGKVMRRVIRAAVLHEDPGDLTALDDAAALEELAALGLGHP